MRRALGVMSALVIAATAGCASRYAYVPTTNAVATVQGRVAADYPIPPDAPRGDLRIASYGITDVTPRNKPGQSFRALHLRILLANNGTSQWTFDTREQRIDLHDRGFLTPAFASANSGSTPPVVTVPAQGSRVVDLFFFLPPDLQHAEEIPEFDALWKVDANPQIVAQRTPFERLLVEPVYDAWSYYGPGYYWGGPSWINPDFPDYPVGYFDGGVQIRRGCISVTEALVFTSQAAVPAARVSVGDAPSSDTTSLRTYASEYVCVVEWTDWTWRTHPH